MSFKVGDRVLVLSPLCEMPVGTIVEIPDGLKKPKQYCVRPDGASDKPGELVHIETGLRRPAEYIGSVWLEDELQYLTL